MAIAEGNEQAANKLVKVAGDYENREGFVGTYTCLSTIYKNKDFYHTVVFNINDVYLRLFIYDSRTGEFIGEGSASFDKCDYKKEWVTMSEDLEKKIEAEKKAKMEKLAAEKAKEDAAFAADLKLIKKKIPFLLKWADDPETAIKVFKMLQKDKNDNLVKSIRHCHLAVVYLNFSYWDGGSELYLGKDILVVKYKWKRNPVSFIYSDGEEEFIDRDTGRISTFTCIVPRAFLWF